MERGSEEGNEYKFRSSKFRKFRRSPWRFVTDTPIAGLFKPGQARKTAGHNTAGKLNRGAHYNFCSCLSVGMYLNRLISSGKWGEKKSQVKTVNGSQCYITTNDLAS